LFTAARKPKWTWWWVQFGGATEIIVLLSGWWLLDIWNEELIYPMSLAVVLASVWAFWSWRRITGSLFDPYAFFLLSTAMFNGGQALLEVFGLNEDGILNGMFASETLLKSLALVVIGISSMHCGALTAAARFGGINVAKRNKSDNKQRKKALRLVGLVLLSVSIIPTGILLRESLDIVMSQGYQALYQQEAETGLRVGPAVLASFFVPASLFLLAGGATQRLYSILSGALLITHSAILLFLGLRYAALAPCVAYAYVWHRARRPLPRGLVFAGVMILLGVAFPVMGSMRNLAGADRLSVESLVDAYLSIENPGVASIAEMGGTLGTIAHTTELVPTIRPYDFGVGYLYAVFGVIPNLFWDLHPAVERGTPSKWLVMAVDPIFAELGGGLGYSFIAEAYLNFGVWGVGVVSFIVGLLYGGFVISSIQSEDPLRYAVVGSYSSFFLVYARADSLSIFRPLFWYALLPLVLVLLLERVWSRSRLASS
jgi:oligosaccharide repeat unit polymerase